MVVKFSDWIAGHHPKFESLTESVVLIMSRLLKDANIPYLAVSGRTKSIKDCLAKVDRKNYKHPITEMTDISGVRIIVYFDYDIEKISRLIETNFNVDKINSSNRDDLLSVNEVGYRSVHYVCDLGKDRIRLTENRNLEGLKLEFQVRTVLQHAWAELAHDRNYKFTGDLPKHIERKLFLLAALMETADNGFSELSKEIDEYLRRVAEATAQGSLDIEINSLSIDEYVTQWAKDNKFRIEQMKNRESYSELVRELKDFGVTTLEGLQAIIPERYAEECRDDSSTVLGIVRDWMMLSDPEGFLENVNVEWSLVQDDMKKFHLFISAEQINALDRALGVEDNWEAPQTN